MKRYEGLIILNTAGKEEGVKELIDAISDEINATGGRVEAVQKMDKRSFVRVANKKHAAGFYVNVIFHLPPASLATLSSRLLVKQDVFRVLLTQAPPPTALAAAAAK